MQNFWQIGHAHNWEHQLGAKEFSFTNAYTPTSAGEASVELCNHHLFSIFKKLLLKFTYLSISVLKTDPSSLATPLLKKDCFKIIINHDLKVKSESDRNLQENFSCPYQESSLFTKKNLPKRERERDLELERQRALHDMRTCSFTLCACA